MTTKIPIASSSEKKNTDSSKQIILQTFKNNEFIFTRGFKEYFVVPENKLDVLFKIIKDYPNHLYCEYPQKNQLVNIKIDLDIKNLEIKKEDVISDIFDQIKIKLKELGHEITTEDLYISNAANRKDKQSAHLTIRGNNFVFNSRLDLKYFMSQIKNEYIDTIIYGDGLIRCPYTSKENEKRPMIPENKGNLSECELFKRNLMTYVTPSQKQNIIKIAPIEQKKEIRYVPSSEIPTDPNIDISEKELWENILNKKIIKRNTLGNTIYIFYVGTCLTCNKIHKNFNKNNVPQKIEISRNIRNIIIIKIELKKMKKGFGFQETIYTRSKVI